MDARATARVLGSLACIAILPAPSAAMPPPPIVSALATYCSGFGGCRDLAFDAAGNLFITGHVANAGRIFKVSPGGATTLFSGQGLDDAQGCAFDAAGALYVVDSGDGDPRPAAGALVRFSPTGTSTPVASGFNHPTSLAIGPDGNFFVAEPPTGSIKCVTPVGVVSTYATGFVNAGEALGALAFDASGDLYAGVGGRIVRIAPGGTPVTTVLSGLDEVRGIVPYGDDFFVATGGHHDLRLASPARGVFGLTSVALSNPCMDGPIPDGASVNLPLGMRLHDGRVYVMDAGCGRVCVFDVALPVAARYSTWGALKACYR